MFRITFLSLILVSCGTDHSTQKIISDQTCNKNPSELSLNSTTTEAPVTDDPVTGQLEIPVCEAATETE